MNTTRTENSEKVFCELFADLFSYPVATYKQSVNQISVLSENQDIHLPGIEAFNQFVQNTTPARLEELFTITFDMNPDTCLELGWHLYGESYQRGEFLVKMRQALDSAGVAEEIELPDHLRHCLLLLGNLPDAEAMELAGNIILPALEKVRRGFSDENLFSSAITALTEYLNLRYSIIEEVQ